MNVTCRQSSKADHGPSSFHRQSCHESGPQSAPEIHVHPRTSNLNVICLRTSLVKSKTSANPYPSKILFAQNNIRWLEACKFLRGNACLMQRHCQSHSQSTRLGYNFRGVKRPDTEGWGLQPQLTRAESVCDLLTTRWADEFCCPINPGSLPSLKCLWNQGHTQSHFFKQGCRCRDDIVLQENGQLYRVVVMFMEHDCLRRVLTWGWSITSEHSLINL